MNESYGINAEDSGSYCVCEREDADTLTCRHRGGNRKVYGIDGYNFALVTDGAMCGIRREPSFNDLSVMEIYE